MEAEPIVTKRMLEDVIEQCSVKRPDLNKDLVIKQYNTLKLEYEGSSYKALTYLKEMYGVKDYDGPGNDGVCETLEKEREGLDLRF